MVWAAFSTCPTIALRRAELYWRVTKRAMTIPLMMTRALTARSSLLFRLLRCMGVFFSSRHLPVHLSQVVIPCLLRGDKPVNHQFRQDPFPFRVLVHRE